MSKYNAFQGQSSDKQSSDGCNTGIGVSLNSSPKTNSPVAPALGGSPQSDSRGAQGSN
jgi:hypothetical protein